MWDLPRPGIEPGFPALAVRLLARSCFAIQEWSDGISWCLFHAPMWSLLPGTPFPPSLPLLHFAHPSASLLSSFKTQLQCGPLCGAPPNLGGRAADSLLETACVLCFCWYFFHTGCTVFSLLFFFLVPCEPLKDRNTVLRFQNSCLVHSRHSVNWFKLFR